MSTLTIIQHPTHNYIKLYQETKHYLRQVSVALLLDNEAGLMELWVGCWMVVIFANEAGLMELWVGCWMMVIVFANEAGLMELWVGCWMIVCC